MHQPLLDPLPHIPAVWKSEPPRKSVGRHVQRASMIPEQPAGEDELRLPARRNASLYWIMALTLAIVPQECTSSLSIAMQESMIIAGRGLHLDCKNPLSKSSAFKEERQLALGVASCRNPVIREPHTNQSDMSKDSEAEPMAQYSASEVLQIHAAIPAEARLHV